MRKIVMRKVFLVNQPEGEYTHCVYNDKLVLTEVGNGQCITYLPNVYDELVLYSRCVNE